MDFDDVALPEILPDDPMPLARAWFDEACATIKTANPNAMTLATVSEQGEPSARVVLCKAMDADSGHLVFYTNYASLKARQLDATGRAAAVFHWDTLERQIRVQGPVVRSPAGESDAYFATRHITSKLGAWASRQSEPIASREALLDQVARVMDELGVDAAALLGEREATIPRPSFWGGYRLWAQRVELWVGGSGRIHDRAVWTRELTPDGEHAFAGSPWTSTRLQP